MTKPAPHTIVRRLGPELYSAWRNSDIGLLTERLERALVLELAGDVAGKTVLDVGCGDGDLALDLWRRGAQVSGIDLSPEMIATARERARTYSPAIAFQIGRAEELPYGAASFDLVVALTILCFVADAAPIFRELARVLRPGGRLVIGELGKWSLWAAERRIRTWRGSKLWKNGRFRTARDLRRLAEKAGFSVTSVRGAIYYPRHLVAARLFAPFDAGFGRVTTFGAAFVALSAVKATPRDSV